MNGGVHGGRCSVFMQLCVLNHYQAQLTEVCVPFGAINISSLAHAAFVPCSSMLDTLTVYVGVCVCGVSVCT